MNTANAPFHTALSARRWREGVAVLAILVALAPCAKAPAADCPPPSQWRTYPTPGHEDLLVLPGSDISAFEVTGAEGDTVYAIGTWNPPDDCIENTYSDENIAAGQAPRLWKSTDSGASWTDITEQVINAYGLPDCCNDDRTWNDFVFFSAIAAAPDDEDCLVVCGYDAMHRTVVAGSDDGGETFHCAGCGRIAGEPLCIDISAESEGVRTIAVGTLDPAGGGSVWLLDIGTGWTGAWHDSGNDPGWTDAWQQMAGTGSRDDIQAVTSVVFSPAYKRDLSLLATVIAYAEEPDGDAYTGYYVVQAARCDDHLLWNGQAGYNDMPVRVAPAGTVIVAYATRPPFFLRQGAMLAVPADYNADHEGNRAVLLVVNGLRRDVASGATLDEGGFAYILAGGRLSSDLLRHERNPLVSSIAYDGGTSMKGSALIGCLLPAPYAWQWHWLPELQQWHSHDGDRPDGDYVLPCCSGPLVLISESLDDCCPRWTRADRGPSGQFNCQLAFSPDGTRAYASTGGDSQHGADDFRWGDESAFSISDAEPVGLHWEQSGLIDTMIDAIEDLNYDPAATCLYLHTSHESGNDSICCCESIWRTCDQGETYRRILLGRPDTSRDDNEAFDDIMDAYHRGFFASRDSGYAYGDLARYAIGDAVDESDREEYGFEADAVYRKMEEGGRGWKAISELTLDYERLLLMECDGCAVPVLYVSFDSLWWDFTTNEPLPYNDDGSDPHRPP
ncbi:MAG TPA: hypothetical protein ENL12_03925, partial [Dehalococcoidia bacterium]|nr:hypothetical protein [Dehalococcoidia bacterium]